MREYRGKDEYGKWIFGDLSHHVNEVMSISSPILHYGCGRISSKVLPVTVGQYTGITDKDGVKIFEGDILTLINADNETINVVCESGTVKREIAGNLVEITGFYFKLPNGRKTFPMVNNYLGKRDLEIMRIIGNIHDNPELLKEGAE